MFVKNYVKNTIVCKGSNSKFVFLDYDADGKCRLSFSERRKYKFLRESRSVN